MKIYAANAAYASANIGVRPNSTAFVEFDATMPAPVTATDPVFIFSHNVDPTLYNLFYVPHMGKRFYNVVSLVYREGGMYEYHCHVNVLLSMMRSWKHHKANAVPTRVLLERTNVPTLLTGDDISESYDAKLYPIKQRKYQLDRTTWSNRGANGSTSEPPVFNVSAPHMVTSMFTRRYQDNERCYVMGYMDNDNGYRVAAMKESTLRSIVANLTSTSVTGISDQALAKFYGSPTDCIRSCKVLPCRWSDMVDMCTEHSISAATSVTLGYYSISGLSNLYILPTQNPNMVMRFHQYMYRPIHPQFGTIPDRIISRAPHCELFINFPPFGLVEVDTTGVGIYTHTSQNTYDMCLMEEIDVMTGEGTLYYKLYHGSTAPTDYNWTATERPITAAKANVCMDFPIMALVQNVSAIRSAQLGLAQLDTKRNMPEAVMNRFIVSAINYGFQALDNSGFFKSSTWSSFGNFADAVSNLGHTVEQVRDGGTKQARNQTSVNSGYTPQVVTPKDDKSGFVELVANQAKKTLAAMDTSYNFTLETAQYKNQLSDAINFPQVSITGNSSGSMGYMNSTTGRVDMYLVYDEFIINGFLSSEVGHECYKVVDNIIDMSYAYNTYPVNRASIINGNVFVRGADEGQLSDPEKTELRAILSSGYTIYSNNDSWN